jgi:hypothetical protein
MSERIATTPAEEALALAVQLRGAAGERLQRSDVMNREDALNALRDVAAGLDRIVDLLKRGVTPAPVSSADGEGDR